jgi:pyruvate dehydrogenase E1 component alpha subunit
MINVFKNIREEDWIFCSWRSHYQCLLKGVPAAEIEKEIMEGRSISLCFPKYKVYSSAIVGGILPIAIGTALSIKRSGEDSKVYCFMGDMTSETGIAHESIKYAIQHKLPIKFIIEDNTKSVCTDTREVWNNSRLIYEGFDNDMIYYYKYETKYPHAGAGVRVQF